MCADMKAQRDDMTDDLHPKGAREIVDDYLVANNQANKRRLVASSESVWAVIDRADVTRTQQ
eukprot:1932670-Pyramimonas_sp.AAC.1